METNTKHNIRRTTTITLTVTTDEDMGPTLQRLLEELNSRLSYEDAAEVYDTFYGENTIAAADELAEEANIRDHDLAYALTMAATKFLASENVKGEAWAEPNEPYFDLSTELHEALTDLHPFPS